MFKAKNVLSDKECMKKLLVICTFSFLALLVYYRYSSEEQSHSETGKLVSNDLMANEEKRRPASYRDAGRVKEKKIKVENSEKASVANQSSESSESSENDKNFDEMMKKNKIIKAKLKSRYHQYKKEGIQFRGNSYVLATDVFAVPKDAYFPNNLPIIEEKYGVYLVYSEDGVAPADSYEVVFNQSSGKFAIYTGIMRITFKDGHTNLAESIVDTVAQENNYSVLYSYDDTELYMRKGKYEFDSYEEGSFIYKTIQNSSQYENFIEKISIEFVENQRDAN